MNRRKLKREVLSILQECTAAECKEKLSVYERHHLLNPLFIALCHPLELVKWHAVCSFGWLVPEIEKNDLEAARVVMRRFLWSLNDESGGIGWGAPESMAEIMCNSPLLRKEYLHMLISYMREDGEELFEDGNFLELPMLQRGLLWGVGRLCQEHLAEMRAQQIKEDIIAYLDSPDLHVRGLAAWCLAQLVPVNDVEENLKYCQSPERIKLFLDNRLQEVSIGVLCGSVMERPEYQQ